MGSKETSFEKLLHNPTRDGLDMVVTVVKVRRGQMMDVFQTCFWQDVTADWMLGQREQGGT